MARKQWVPNVSVIRRFHCSKEYAQRLHMQVCTVSVSGVCVWGVSVSGVCVWGVSVSGVCVWGVSVSGVCMGSECLWCGYDYTCNSYIRASNN